MHFSLIYDSKGVGVHGCLSVDGIRMTSQQTFHHDVRLAANLETL